MSRVLLASLGGTISTTSRPSPESSGQNDGRTEQMAETATTSAQVLPASSMTRARPLEVSYYRQSVPAWSGLTTRRSTL